MSAPPASPALSSGRLAAAWVEGGVLAGALVGALDAELAVMGGIGGLSDDKAHHLVAIAAVLLAAVGGLAGVLCAAAGALARRTAVPERTAGLLAALAASPLVVFDAFSLFTGHRAASVPAHGVLSVVLALGGLFAVGWVVRRLARWLAHRQSARRPWLLALALLAAGLACQEANRLVLLRLYGWFHLSLAAATLLCVLLAVRLLIRAGRLWRAGLLVVATALSCVPALAALRGSQGLRYAAYERTAVTAIALRALPSRRASPATVAAGGRRSGADLAPLPPGPHRPDADVLLITIDALRADHVGAYGYPRPTTPNIDRLAAGGVRFERAYSQVPHTSFSVSSMMTSKYFPTMVRLAPGERHETLAAVLRNYGWKTGAFYPPAVFYIDSDKLKIFAATNFNFEYVKFEFIDAQRRVDQLLHYYDTVQPKRSFVWVHFFEPHEPYVAHDGFSFGSGDLDRYDSEIAYTDAAVGRLVREVRQRRPGTIVILSADHGEEFDDHGGRYHGSSLYEEQLRIPLIISVPGVTPHVVGGQVQLIDVPPTVLGLLDISVPVRMRGTDLGPWLATPAAPAARLPPAYAELEDKRMVSIGGEKLICDMRVSVCAYYDLRTDPHERHNLAEQRPQRVKALRAMLDGWLDAHLRLEPPVRSAKLTIGADGTVPKPIERGRLGDVGAAPDLAALLGTAAPLVERREAVSLLLALPPQAETARALSRAAGDRDPTIAAWASVGALRVGDRSRHDRVVALVEAPKTDPALRLRAALALAATGDASGLSVLSAALGRHDDIPLDRNIITTLGALNDRRAVSVLLQHLPEVMNRREMVAALGQLGPLADPVAIEPLIASLLHDNYVPVRAEAARALAKIAGPGDARRVLTALEQAARHDTEPMVIEAARTATTALKARGR